MSDLLRCECAETLRLCSNPRFLGLKFPDMSRPETLEKKYLGKCSKRSMNFLKSVMKMNPPERITSNKALMHNYFEDLVDKDDDKRLVDIAAQMAQEASVEETSTHSPLKKTHSTLSSVPASERGHTPASRTSTPQSKTEARLNRQQPAPHTPGSSSSTRSPPITPPLGGNFDNREPAAKAKPPKGKFALGSGIEGLADWNSPAMRAQTQGGGHRKRHDDEGHDTIHTSRSSTKNVRPSSPSSLVDWPSSHPIHLVMANAKAVQQTNSSTKIEEKVSSVSNPYQEAYGVRVMTANRVTVLVTVIVLVTANRVGHSLIRGAGTFSSNRWRQTQAEVSAECAQTAAGGDLG